jgi:hypothetical protein
MLRNALTYIRILSIGPGGFPRKEETVESQLLRADLI